MPRACTVCQHPERDAINHALVSDTSNRRIAAQYSLSEQAVRRHKAEHLPSIMVKSQEASDVAHADQLLAEVNRLYRVAIGIMEKSSAKKPETALRAIGVAGRMLELLGELMGELNRQPQVNILVAPEWLQVRTVLLRALQPHPDARAAVAAALVTMEPSNGGS